jgi:hypothetical protein
MQDNKPALKKFNNWIQSEILKGNQTVHEGEAMYQDFANMSESRLKKLAVNFNL